MVGSLSVEQDAGRDDGPGTGRDRATLRSARRGPWTSFVEGRDHASGSNFIMVGDEEHRGEDIELTGATVDDQDFIAHARQDVPRRLAEVRRLRGN